jgi:hypothetical protein
MTRSQRLGDHLRSNVVAYVALFVALGGTAAALPGSNSVKSNDLARGAVKAKALADAAVSNPKLRTGAVSSAKIADGSVVSVDLGDGAITNPKLVDDAVTRAKIAAGQVNGGKIANGAINSPKVDDGSLQAEDFAPGQLSDGFANAGDPATFALPRAGRLFIVATFVPTCTAPTPCAYVIKADGSDVPGTSLSSSANGSEQLTLVGVSGPLAAGNHTIDIDQAGAGALTQVTIAAVLLQ